MEQVLIIGLQVGEPLHKKRIIRSTRRVTPVNIRLDLIMDLNVDIVTGIL